MMDNGDTLRVRAAPASAAEPVPGSGEAGIPIASHTPGPWHVHGPERMENPEKWHGYAWVGYGDGDQWDGAVAKLYRHDDASPAWRDAALPDARLIAAAPDLLAALKGAVGALEFSRDYHSDLGNADQAFAQDRLDAALKAIANAEKSNG